MRSKSAFTLARTGQQTPEPHLLSMVVVLLLVCTLTRPAAGQQDTAFTGDKASLEYLRYLFHEDKDIGAPYQYLKDTYKNRILPELVDKFLPHDPVATPKKGYYAGNELIANDQYVALAYDKPCYKGNLCRTRYLTILDYNGEQVAHTVLGYDSSTSVTLDTMRGKIIQQRLVEKVATHVEYASASQTRASEDNIAVKYHYHKLSDEGRLSPIPTLSNSPDRKYHWSSKRLVQPAELDEFTRREQNILKNEIFADYNFRFPSDRWRAYFADKAWYEPKHQNVSDSLNLIERFNIKRIIRYQRNDS